MDNLTQEFNQLSISTIKSHKKKALKAKSKQQKKAVLKVCLPLEIEVLVDPAILEIDQLVVSKDIKGKVNNALTYTIVNKNQEDFKTIKTLFAKNGLRVKSVKKVNNPYLQKAFELNRHMKYGGMVPKTLFHGTRKENIDNICTYNFDWRLGGTQTGYRHGKGVNFTKLASFAKYFCEKKFTRVMIIADVLVKKVVKGNENMVVPPRGKDTTSGKNGTIFVKFYDNEFCPRYVVDFQSIQQP